MYVPQPLSAEQVAKAQRTLKAMLKDPSALWIPLTQPSANLSNGLEYHKWITHLPRMDEYVHLPSRKDIEALVEAYFRMGHWDFAYVIVCLAYTGEPELPSLKDIIWEGYPGFSRMWLRRGDNLLPVPLTGPIRLAFETWWCLSMGYSSPTRRFIRVRYDAFEDHFRSLDSPIIHLMPFGYDDPDLVLDALKKAHANDLAYPRFIPKLLDVRTMLPEAEERGGLVWYGGVPVGFGSDTVARLSQGEARKPDAPWGMNWLEAAKDSIPPRIYQMAKAVRVPPVV